VHRLELRLRDTKQSVTLFDNVCEQTITDEQMSEVIRVYVSKRVDFPSEMKQKLLARRLSKLLTEIGKGENTQQAMTTFVAALNPFAAITETSADALSEGCLADELQVQMTTEASAPFCPWEPCVNQMDGSMEERVRLSHSIFLYDVFQDSHRQGRRHVQGVQACGPTHEHDGGRSHRKHGRGFDGHLRDFDDLQGPQRAAGCDECGA
jgi:hypothetical protein